MKKTFFVLLIGWTFYFLIKYFSPLWVGHLHHIEAFDLLNRLSLGQGHETLEFYQGRIQETFFGPSLQILSTLLLAFLISRHCVNSSLGQFAGIIFLFLLITKFEVLTFPPYGDAIGGPFAEALWLYQNHFNYAGLFNQPNFDVGGQRVYFFSIYPGFLALTLKLIPWTTIFLIFHHVLTFALTAGIIAMMRECGRKNFGQDLAWLSSLVLLSLPLFQSQCEAINMEIPVAFFAVWSAYSLTQRRWGRSALFACLAAATKGIGIIACTAVAVVFIVLAFRAGKLREKIKLFILTFIAIAMAAFIGGAKFFFKDTHVQQGLVRWDAGWPSLRKEFIFYLFLMSLLVFLLSLLVKFLNSRKKHEPYGDQFIPSVMFLFAGTWFLLFFNFYAVSPRYRVTLYPFLVFVVVYGVTCILKWGIVQRLAAVGVLIVSCWLSYGIFYGSIPENDHVLLERSLEYRNDLEVNRRLIRIAQERYNNQLIVAPFTIAQALAIPELGYVKTKLNVMIYGFGLKYGGILNYPGLRNLDPSKTVFIGVKVAPIDSQFSYPVGPNDVILEEIAVGNKKASFFIGGYSIETLWRMRRGLI
jgi:hypothetical protein